MGIKAEKFLNTLSKIMLWQRKGRIELPEFKNPPSEGREAATG